MIPQYDPSLLVDLPVRGEAAAPARKERGVAVALWTN
jgi:hypothetical protein